MNLMIESLEGGNFLASVVEGDNKTLVRDNDQSPHTFHSLHEVKEHFAQQQFDEVWLKQTTPYDEMCGQDTNGDTLEMLIDWH